MGWLIGSGLATIVLALTGYWAYQQRSRWPEPVNPVTGSGAEVAVLDFSSPFLLDPLPDGWWHRRFLTRSPMEVQFAEVDGVPGLRCLTDDSGSIFGRFADIRLSDYPLLSWQWRVDEPVRTELDERTPEGDDHPARLYLRFETADGARKAMEIIWSNGAFRPGEYKYIGGFPHYVAESGVTALREWVNESLDLQSIYHEIWGAGEAPRLVFLGIFCDTDDTGGTSEAMFSTVRMARLETAE